MNKNFTLFLFLVLLANAQAQVVLRIKSLPNYTPVLARFSIVCEQNDWNASDSNFLFKKVKNSWVLKLPALRDTFFYKIARFSNNKMEVDSAFNEVANRMILPTAKGELLVNILNWSDFKKVHSDNDNVEIVSDSFYSESLGSSRKIWIYLPNDYYKDKQKRFPVIYALQGQNTFDNYTADNTEWRIDETLKSMQNKNDNGCIVVAIESLKNKVDQETDLYYKGFYQNDTSLAKYFGYFVSYELKPYIDSAYKTKQYKDYNAIIGAGKYAQLALSIALKHSYYFSKIGMFSPVFSNEDSLYKFIENNKRRQSTKVFLTVGYNDSIAKPEASEKLRDFLLEKADFFDSEVNLDSRIKGIHDETFWASMFKPCYIWLFEGMNNYVPAKRTVNNNTERNEITAKVYPNPAKANVTIESDASLVRILSEKGDLMEEFTGSQPRYFNNRIYYTIRNELKTYNIDLTKYKAGNYYVVFSNKSNNTSISRILIVQ